MGSGSQRHGLSMLVDSICGEGTSMTRRDSVDEVSSSFASYLQPEITSIVEMALWKLKMMQMEEEDLSGTADRNFCRYKCGADIVIPNVTKFIWDDRSSSFFAGPLLINSSIQE